jgi:acetyl-CoA carboxylase biotin carboxyl carrier protein
MPSLGGAGNPSYKAKPRRSRVVRHKMMALRRIVPQDEAASPEGGAARRRGRAASGAIGGRNGAEADGRAMTKGQHDDIAFIRALADLLRESDLTELEVSREFGEDDELRVRLTRANGAVVAAAPIAVAPAPALYAAPPLAPAPARVEPAAAPALPEDPAAHPGAVTSPMVGTAYLSPEPGAAPYVKIGDSVREGQTLLIIEAMKTMNQIPAPRAGVVRRILIEDKQPVEFGAPLMIVE